MKPETKDWIKKTAGTSALIASPGIIAASLAGGLPIGLLVGGAVAAGNVLGSAAYKKAKEIEEDVKNRKKFQELQKQVLAENGVLNYQPIKAIPTVGPGDMAVASFDLKTQIAKPKPIMEKVKDWQGKAHEEFIKSQLDEHLKQPYSQKPNFSCGKDMSCLGKILHKDFGPEVIIGNLINNTSTGQKLKRVVNTTSDLLKGVGTRNGHRLDTDINKTLGLASEKCFSEDSLLSVDEEELNHMREDISFTDDPSEKELKKSRYLSMLNEVSRDKLQELLEANKEKEKVAEPSSPVGMFSESPNLMSIAKGRDFGVLSSAASAFKIFTKGAKAASASKVADAISKATPTVEKAIEASPKGGLIGKLAEGIGKVTKNAKEGFLSGSGKAVADAANGAKEAVEKGAEVAENAVKQGARTVGDAAKKGADIAKEAKSATKLSEIQGRISKGGTVNKYELQGIKMAGKSQASARLGEAIGYENLGKLNKTVKTVAAQQAVETAQKNEQRRQQAG